MERTALECVLDEIGEPVLGNPLVVFAILEHRPERGPHDRLVELCHPECAERRRPIDRLGNTGRFVEVQRPQPLDRAGHLPRQSLVYLRNPQSDDFDFPLETGMFHPVVQTASLQCVMHVPGPIRGEHHDGNFRCSVRADLGNGHLDVGEKLEEIRLEFVVGAVDFVDEEYGCRAVARLDCPEQCPPNEKTLVVQFALQFLGGFAGRLAAGFRGS